MTNEDLERLGSLVYGKSLTRLKKPRQSRKALVVGFDTEYDPQTSELFSIQFSHDGTRDWYVIPPGFELDWDTLEFFVLDFLSERCGISIANRHVRAIKLICYFSVAESQHIGDLTDATIFETSVGTDFVYRGRGGRTIEIFDLMKFFSNPRQPLAKVAASFGYEKLDWKRDQITRDDLDDPAFKDYACNDAEITEQIFNDLRREFLDSYNVDIALTKTPAQTAATIFRLQYLSADIESPEETRLRRMALLSAWGGRNEAFRRGQFEGTFYEYDAFSEYPNSAIELGKLPRAEDWRLSKSLSDVREFHGFGVFRFRFPDSCEFPCLPVFTDNKLLYPLRGRTFCTNEEIRLALDLGAAIEVLEAYHYRDGITDLSRFMETLLKERGKAKAKGDKIRSHALKLIINSLIGKFIQRVDTTDLNELVELEKRSGIPIADLRLYPKDDRAALAKDFGLDPDELHRVSLGSAFVPEWNSLILGYARASTSRFLVEIASEGHRPMITSTDSVIFEQNGDPPRETYMVRGIRFERRERGTRMQVVRTRLYRVQAGNVTVKLAHHAVAGKAIAEEMFDDWRADPDLPSWSYSLKRITKLRESLAGFGIYGQTRELKTTVSLGFDFKRRFRNGTGVETWAWQRPEDYLARERNPV